MILEGGRGGRSEGRTDRERGPNSHQGRGLLNDRGEGRGGGGVEGNIRREGDPQHIPNNTAMSPIGPHSSSSSSSSSSMTTNRANNEGQSQGRGEGRGRGKKMRKYR